MNVIHISVTQNVFKPGETILGAVYVKVTQPTPATCIVLRFQGYEHYYYSCIQLANHTEEDVNRTLQESKEHVQNTEYVLLNSKEPIPIGCYVFPFQLNLPTDIPGSCQVKSNEGPFWMMNTVYKLTAQFEDKSRCLNETQVEHELTVLDGNHNTRDDAISENERCSETSFTKNGVDLANDWQTKEDERGLDSDWRAQGGGTVKDSVKCHTKLSRWRNKQFITEASVNQYHNYSGDNLSLNIDFTTKGLSAEEASVQSLHVKLKQRIELTITYMNKPVRVYPLGESRTLWEQPLRTTLKTHLQNSIANLLIPVPPDVLPTSSGHFFSCSYCVSVEVALNKHKSTIYVEVPVAIHTRPPCISQSCKEPPWSRDCQLKLTQHDALLRLDGTAGFFRSRMPVLYEKLRQTVVQLD